MIFIFTIITFLNISSFSRAMDKQHTEETSNHNQEFLTNSEAAQLESLDQSMQELEMAVTDFWTAAAESAQKRTEYLDLSEEFIAILERGVPPEWDESFPQKIQRFLDFSQESKKIPELLKAIEVVGQQTKDHHERMLANMDRMSSSLKEAENILASKEE